MRADPKAPPPLKSEWVPGGATPPRQPPVVWTRVLGVVVAIAAQAGLYLGLHQISNVAMPPWAHRPARPGPLPWPALVPVTVVKGRDRVAVPGTGTATLPAPVLSPPPVVVLEPPELRLRPSAGAAADGDGIRGR